VSKAKTVVLAVLSAWQWTGRFRQPACRFYPSCSQYAKQAIERHGIAAGMRLGVARICKCHPFHDGGVDEVPEVLKAGRRYASPVKAAGFVRAMANITAFIGWCETSKASGFVGAMHGVARLQPCIALPMQIVMKSGLNPVFAGMKDRIFAQAFCLKTPDTGDMQDAKNAKNAKNSTISDNSALSTISALSNNMLANTSRSA
jgi:putative membrane protein insertion efficiency factor